MKMKIYLALPIVLLQFSIHAQNIGIGTTSPESKLHIKGSADTSQLIIDANATQSSKHPLIQLRNAAGLRLLDIHSDDTTNAFFGRYAGLSNNAGSGVYNSFIGSAAGSSNTSGHYNTAIGASALKKNSTGSENTAIGMLALSANTTGTGNSAGGSYAMLTTKTGDFNTAFGVASLLNNFGDLASYNTCVGYQSLCYTTNSQYNTAVGYSAGYSKDNGYNNVFVGANTDVNGPGYYNVIAIGQGTICTASSQVTIGNGATTSYRAYSNWSNISDGRFKKNIQENVPGLDFITQLRPVTYNLKATELDNFLRNNENTVITSAGSKERKASPGSETAKAVNSKALQEKDAVVYTGFVAQEVESSAKKLGFNFSGIDAPANDKDVYALRYAEFVVPLVKAVQELADNNKTQQQQVEAMKTTISNLQKQIEDLKALIKK